MEVCSKEEEREMVCNMIESHDMRDRKVDTHEEGEASEVGVTVVMVIVQDCCGSVM